MAGKLDSRQKMINMMYLVFIAMLALNIGKEVLATIGILNDDLQSSITELHDSSKEAYGTIQSNSTSLDYKIAASKVTEMQAEADTFFNFIQGIKDSLIVGEEGENKYLKMVTNKETGADEISQRQNQQRNNHDDCGRHQQYARSRVEQRPNPYRLRVREEASHRGRLLSTFGLGLS